MLTRVKQCAQEANALSDSYAHVFVSSLKGNVEVPKWNRVILYPMDRHSFRVEMLSYRKQFMHR